MSKKIRYILIAIGLVVFLVLAPAMVLYVTGTTYDFARGRFTGTGILAVRTDPSSVSVLLDGKQVRSSDGDIKFLSPGEYSLTVQKPGYQSWSKRFFIQSNQVVWASPVPNKIFLFKQDVPSQSLADGVTDFSVAGNIILTLSARGLALSTADNSGQSQNYILPKPVTAITAVSPDGKNFLLSGPNAVLLFNAKTQSFTDIGSLFAAPVAARFGDNDNIYALSGNKVYSINDAAKAARLIIGNARAFSVAQNTVYYISGGSLYSLSLAGGQPQTLAAGMPAFSSADIYVNYQKQIILLLDGALYQVSSTLVPLADDITAVNFNPAESSLLVLHTGELDFYNYADQNLTFLTRSSVPLQNFIFRPDLGYVFFFKDKALEALEIDLRDHQNQYVFATAQTPQKFQLSDDGKTIYTLDGGRLTEQVIR